MQLQFTLDRTGIGEVLRSPEMVGAVDELARQIAAGVRGDIEDPDVADTLDVDAYVTDRAAASITIAHPMGMPLQAKHGVLTGAAAALGLDVRSR